MVIVICIDDSKKPHEIPNNKWVKRGNQYEIIRICRMLKQSDILGCELAEICLDETNAPYELFRLDRFAFRMEDWDELMELISMTDERIELEELLKEQLVEID